MSFDFDLRTRLVFGAGVVDRIGELARELGATRVFVVTDAGIVAAGHCERVEELLRESGIALRRFDSVSENPTTEDADACRASLGDWDVDLLVGLGGGSAIDVAKACALLHAGGGRIEDYHGHAKARGDVLPLIAIPTTAGTGTEVQSYALIAEAKSHQKMACGDPQLAPRVAVLDPELTMSQPPAVTACTGMDAIAHAVETAVSLRRTGISSVFATHAFVTAERSLPRVLASPDDLVARGDMLLAAAYAGIAIENSMLGAAHSIANPLTARYGIAHGQAVGLMLPSVMRFNAADDATAAVYGALARSAGLCDAGEDDASAAEVLIERLHGLVQLAGFEPELAAYGLTRDAVPIVAAEAASQWTAQFNPRPVDAQVLAEILVATGVR